MYLINCGAEQKTEVPKFPSQPGVEEQHREGGECTELSSVKTASAGECNLIKMKNISLPIMLETVNRERGRKTGGRKLK